METYHLKYIECGSSICLKCWKNKSKLQKAIQDNNRKNQGKDITFKEYFIRLLDLHQSQIIPLSIGISALSLNTIIQTFAPKQHGRLIDKLVNNKPEQFYAAIKVSIFLTVSRGILENVNRMCSRLVFENVIFEVQQKLYKALLSQDMQFYDGVHTRTLNQKMRWGLRSMITPFQTILKTAFAQSISLIGSFYMCWSINWRLTILGLTTLGPITYLTRIMSTWTRQSSTEEWKLRNEIASVMYKGFENVRTVRAFGKEPEYYQFYMTLRELEQRKVLQNEWGKSMDSTIRSWFGLFSRLLLTWAGGLLVLKDKERRNDGNRTILTVGLFITFELYWKKFTQQFEALKWQVNSFEEAAFVAKSTFAILDAKPSIEIFNRNEDTGNEVKYDDLNDAPNGSLELESIDGDIKFENVEFYYQTSPKKKVIKGINLTIPKGKVTALVGRSGGGKSTLMHLLLRFYDPTNSNENGRITINGVDLKKFNPYSLRKQIALVAQETELFDDTLRNNIAFGVQKYTINDVEQSAKLANAHNFIQKKG